jgi:hypothetical protein
MSESKDFLRTIVEEDLESTQDFLQSLMAFLTLDMLNLSA